MIDHHTPTSRDIDSPLTKSDEDALGRIPYAEHVAEMIAGWRGDHSAVFAIYGEWGSGKTSFKNFILEKLKGRPESSQPLIVEFNPWEWEGPRQVTEAFFARLVEGIGEKAPNGADASHRLSRYATYFTLGASIADSAATVLPWIVPAGGNLATLLSKFLKEAGAQTKIASEAMPENQSLSRARADVVESIRSIRRPVLVTIDDVDRLTTAETAILFQLLKANADFPNVVYLILCDREVVARNLEKVVAGHGDDYLEKIVQLGLPLPKAYPDQLRAALLDGLQTEIRNAGVERLLDKYRLFTLYDEHAAPFFRTMRDVKRFLAGISALLPAVTRNGDAAVDLVDFIGIELLRTFDHEFYEAIYCYRARITGREGVMSKDKEFVEELAGERDPGGATLGVFGDLFTRFGPARKFARRPRIGHPRTFDRYFLFAVPPDQYTPAEENDILVRRGRPQFVKELEAARERGRLQYLLELLAGAEPPREREAAINYLTELAAFADTLHVNDGAEEEDSYRAQVERLVFACLKHQDPVLNADLLVTACERSNAIWLTARFEEHFRQREPNELTEEGKSRLKELAIQRLGSSVALRAHPAVGDLLLWCLENGAEEGARAVAEEMLETTESLFDFIHAFSHLNLANIGKARKRVSGFRTFAHEINRLIPIEKVLARVDEIEKEPLTSTQRELIRALRDDAQRMAHTPAQDLAEADASGAASTEVESAPGEGRQ